MPLTRVQEVWGGGGGGGLQREGFVHGAKIASHTMREYRCRYDVGDSV